MKVRHREITYKIHVFVLGGQITALERLISIYIIMTLPQHTAITYEEPCFMHNGKTQIMFTMHIYSLLFFWWIIL